jgi:N4-gp56 family major capsid protein
VIDKALEAAVTASPLIRPIKYQGENMYVCFLHPVQVTDLRTSTSTGQWLDIQKAAMTGGRVNDNPIFTGALGVYNNIVLHSAFRIPQAVNAGTRLRSPRPAALSSAVRKRRSWLTARTTRTVR